MDEIIEPIAGQSMHEPSAGAFPERLAERVGAFAPTGFAMLDGGLFDDLPGALRRKGLCARSLFLEHADVEAERAGPWLVPLAQADDAPEKVFALLGAEPSAVFWSCASGEAALFRHLRTLNLARIPAWAAAGANGPHAERFGQGYETVTFRHWDSCVLAALLPVLDAEQFAKLIGCAQETALHCEAFGGLKRVIPDPGWPAAPGGMLTIRDEQSNSRSARKNMASDNEIDIEALRFYVNSVLTHISDDLNIKHLKIDADHDFFWEVPLDDLFDVRRPAPTLAIGSAADSLEFVQSAIGRGAKQSDAAALMLMHVIPLLQVICGRVRA